MQELLATLKSQEATLGISAISITAERELELDFSQRMFDAGLQILAPVQSDHTASVRSILAKFFFDRGVTLRFGDGFPFAFHRASRLVV